MKIQEFDEVKKAMSLTSSPPLWSSDHRCLNHSACFSIVIHPLIDHAETYALHLLLSKK
ncbi:unnamed protein product [Prunus brigantina]